MLRIIFRKVRIKEVEPILMIKSVRMHTDQSSSNYKRLLINLLKFK